MAATRGLLRAAVAVQPGRLVGRLDGAGLDGLDLLAQLLGEGLAVALLEVAQLADGLLQLVALGLQTGEELGTPGADLTIEIGGLGLRLVGHLLGVHPGLGLDPVGAGPRVGGQLVRLLVGVVELLLRVTLGLGDQVLGLLGGHLHQPDHRGAGLGAGGDDHLAAGRLGLRRLAGALLADGLLRLGLLRLLLELLGLLLPLLLAAQFLVAGLAPVLAALLGLLERLDLLLEGLVLLGELGEGGLDAVDEQIDLRHLVAGPPGHMELRLADFVQGQGHRSPQQESGAGPHRCAGRHQYTLAPRSTRVPSRAGGFRPAEVRALQAKKMRAFT